MCLDKIEIVRMDYVGGATVFRLSVISPNRGAVYGKNSLSR